MNIQRPRGTKDVYTPEVRGWQKIEQQAMELCDCYGFSQMRFPTFEYTELFARGVGDTTDVVQKEMYQFFDRDQRSITLRPEGTASVVRAFLENSLYGGAMPAKYYYLIPCFRYEKPQAGRLREFHQFGAEVFGAAGPQADAEVIALADAYLRKIGLREIRLMLNSIGCPTCRASYFAALKEYLTQRKEQLCPTCLDRLEKNPMRVLDCKSPICQQATEGAPLMLDYLCEDCAAHFEGVKALLTDMGIDYTIDPRIVRGLDYYTRTVFEFVSESIGSQGTVCGGGRYDGLVEQLGGKPTPGLGFAMGLERLLMVLESQGESLSGQTPCDLYFAPIGQEAQRKVAALARTLRDQGVAVQYDVMDRSIKAQMKYADKLGARYTMVVGDDELAAGQAQLKCMSDGSTRAVVFTQIFDALGAQE